MNSYEDSVNTPIISPIVIVKNLPCYVDEVALKLFITQQGFYAENIRLEKQIETGFPVFHGYVTFPNAIVAQSWFNVNQVCFVMPMEWAKSPSPSIYQTDFPCFLIV